MKNRGLKKFYNLVDALESLPSIGKKSAHRLAHHMIIHDQFIATKLAHTIEEALVSIKSCIRCGFMSENELCELCLDDSKNAKHLCIVENSKDIFLIEDSETFNGKYFVLDSLESQTITKLQSIIKTDNVQEIIFALTPSISNDAIILFIEDKLLDFSIKFTKIAQGVPTGVHLENIDMLSLTRAIESRVKI